MAGDPNPVPGPAVLNHAPAVDEYGEVVRIAGAIPTTPQKPANSALTAIAADVNPVVLLAANANRIGFSIRNTSADDTLYVKASAAGGAVSSTYHTVALVPGAYYEDPYGYTGEVSGVWAPAATGDALVDEYTP